MKSLYDLADSLVCFIQKPYCLSNWRAASLADVHPENQMAKKNAHCFMIKFAGQSSNELPCLLTQRVIHRLHRWGKLPNVRKLFKSPCPLTRPRHFALCLNARTVPVPAFNVSR